MDFLPAFRKPSGLDTFAPKEQTKPYDDTNISRQAVQTEPSNEKLREIAALSGSASEHHQRGNKETALECYKKAFDLSREIRDNEVKKTCAFNVGSGYIANGKYEEGLEYLRKAMPQNDHVDDSITGDLYYNTGLCHENMEREEEALVDFQEASKQYEKDDNLEMRIRSLEKCEELYKALNQFSKAANISKQIVNIMSDKDSLDKAEKLSERATELRLAGSLERARKTAGKCKKMLQNRESNGRPDCLNSGRIWNDLGIVFTQLHEHEKALQCFQKALEQVRKSQKDIRVEATALQNIGAAYNLQKDYRKAVEYHKNAIKLFASLHDRDGQGQCFANLAFAYVKLGDQKQGEIEFHHALQAAKDTGDNCTKWQALEGLGAIYYNQGNKQQAFEYFTRALQNMEEDHPACERIKNKLSQIYSGNRTIVEQTRSYYEQNSATETSFDEYDDSENEFSNVDDEDDGKDNEQNDEGKIMASGLK